MYGKFCLELSRHRVPPVQDPLSVAVLTARAREFLFALEIGDSHQISMEFKKCGERNGLKNWGRGPVLYGSVREWIWVSQKSERKANNFSMLVKDDGRGGRGRPSGAEGGYVFVGDTGEGDARAGELMCEAYPQRMRAVFLHVVSGSLRQDKVALPPDKEVNGVPIVHFRTYVGAASKALQLGLMDKGAVSNVMEEAKKMLADTPKSSSKWKDLDRDLALAKVADALLPNLVRTPPIAAVDPKEARKPPDPAQVRRVAAAAGVVGKVDKPQRRH